MSILTLNAGSSSLKVALFEERLPPARLFGATIPTAPGDVHVLDRLIERLAPYGGLARVAAIGHRFVLGGRFERPVVLDDSVLDELRPLAHLDPDHLPVEIALVDAMRERANGLLQAACFDTAFHASMPRVARLLPLPRAYEAKGIRRYGFHGLSYQYLLEELGRQAGEPAARGRLVLAHLGSGASLSAVRDGRAVDTTMSFTPNSGVPMGTRSGDLDPGVLIHLMRHEKMDVDALDEMLSLRSGLLGVSGLSSDMRELLGRESTDPASAEAVALFCHSVTKAIGALAAALDGLDTLVFSAGIGERAPVVRARVSAGLSHLGVELDAVRNASNAPVISTDASRCAVRVIPTDEQVVIAHETMALMGGTP